MNARRLSVGSLLVLCLFAQLATAASTTVVISQVYGGGGNSGSTWKNDFIELHNVSSAAVNLSGWSVQYASAAGTTWTNKTNLIGTIAPGGYYLVQEAAGTGGTLPLPAPDAIGSIAMSATDGKVALVNNTTALSGNGCPFSAAVVDFVGYGSANCFEGTAAPKLANANAAIRAGDGCIDTDNNAADFVVTTNPTPRNTAAPPTCGGTVVIPPVPAGLAAVAGDQQVSLTWNTSFGATFYNVKRLQGGVYQTIASPSVASFNDTGLTNGVTFSYVVSAVNSAGESLDSTPVSATPQAPLPSNAAHVYFIDIGQGASTLIVSPTGKTMLIDGGPDASGTAILGVLNALHINTLDYTVLTHYHVDHDAGLTAVLNSGKTIGTAYDVGDIPTLLPPSLTGSTGQAYTAYKNAALAHAAQRMPLIPGIIIDLGGGMRAICLASGGTLLGGGSVPISNTDLNSESISLVIEYGDFDFLISGDLTGGGSTTTATTPDVETFVGQLAGDVDVVQLDHHGSTTASNQRFLSAIHAEVAVAQAGSTNTFGHPNRETVNKFLNTPDSASHTFPGTGAPPFLGHGTVFYEMEPPVSGDTRVTQQAWVASPIAGQGTIEIDTDGATNYTVHSFVGSTFTHAYPLDGATPNVVLGGDFPPTVMPSISPAVPLATDAVTVTAQVSGFPSPVMLSYTLDGGTPTSQPMASAGPNWIATIPPQPNGTRVDYTVSATFNGKTTTYTNGYFSGITPVATLRAPSAYNSLGEPRYLGYPVRVQGLITAGTGTYNSGANNDDYLQDATGGINIFRTTDPASNPAMQPTFTGETDSVAGLVGMNVGRLRVEVTPPFIWTSSSTPYPITNVAGPVTPVPAPHTLADIAANAEALEGTLVSVANCHVTGGTIPSSGGSDGFLTVSDGTTSFTMKADKDTDLFGAPTPGGNFTLVGIVQQDQPLRPFFGAYNLAPRGRTDIGLAPGTTPTITIAAARIDVVDNTDGTAGADFVPDLLNQNVHVRGVVTSTNQSSTSTQYVIQDDTAGITVFGAAALGTPAIGTYVDVTGPVSQFNGVTEISVGSNLRNVTVVPNGPALPVPQLVTLSQLANGVGEALEGKLIRINNVSATPGVWPANGNINVTDGTGSAQIRIVSSTDIDGTPIPSVPFSVVGVVGQFDSAAPFDSGYQVFPRSLADIVPSLTASPSPLLLGTVALGSTSTGSVTITNSGVLPVTLLAPFAVTGPDASFTATVPSTLTLAPGTNTTTDVTFAPTTTGPKAATLAIASTAGTILVPVSGIAVCGSVALTPSLSGGTYGAAYSATLTATGGASPYSFTLTGGTLPTGVSLASNGSVSGTLTAAGTFTFTVQATDRFGCSGSQSYSVTIDRAPLTVAAVNASRPYGSANPALGVTYSGFVLGDTAAGLGGTLNVGTTATTTSVVGTYPIVPSGLTSSNYTITFAPATLTVTPVTLHVKADDQSIVFGDPLPAFTATITGFVLGETSAIVTGGPAFTTTATASSLPGDYAIDVAQGTLAAPNYTFDFAPGTLHIGGIVDSLQSLIDELTKLRDAATGLERIKLDDAIKHLQNAISDKLWLDSIHPKSPAVFTETKGAAIDLVFLLAQSDSTLPAVQRLIADVRVLALTAINDAVARGASPKLIDAARSELSKGDDDVAMQQFESGLEHYRNAWSKAGSA